MYFSGNGMSEALYLFTMILTSRYLLRWLRRGDLQSLVYSAAALGVAYLARNEAVGSAVLAGPAVMFITYRTSRGLRQTRVMSALTDGVIFLSPVITTFAGWAIASYVITKQFFQQFSSIYGTAAQLKVEPNGVKTHAGRLLEEIKAVEALAPLLVVLLVAAVVVAIRRRDLGVIAPIAVIGGGLLFDVGSYFANSISYALRYYILAIPLGIILVGSLFAGQPGRRSVWSSPADSSRRAVHARPQSRGWNLAHRGVVGALIAATLCLPTFPTTVLAMINPQLGGQEQQGLGFIFSSHPSAYDLSFKAHWQHVQEIDNYLAHLHLPNRQIIMDNFALCGPDLVTQSDQPRLFVIPNDRAFQRTLAAPLTFHAHYFLVPQPEGTNSINAVSTAYPNIWADGGGVGKLVKDFPAGGSCGDFRLYKVLRTPQTTS